jgi:hypothetical protein
MSRSAKNGFVSLPMGMHAARRSRLWLAAALCSACTGAVVSPAYAGFEITDFGGSATDSTGARLSQAGAHPDVTTEIRFKTRPFDGREIPDENVKDVAVDLPPGLIGNPQAVPRCTDELMENTGREVSACPLESAVGTASVQTTSGGGFTVAVYNIAPPVGVAARFAFNINRVVVNIDAKVRTVPDTVVSATVRGASQTLSVYSVKLTLWGAPADPANDDERGACADAPVPDGCPSTEAVVPLMTSPTSCSGQPLRTAMTADSWQNPGTFRTAAFDTDFDGFPIKSEGCDRVGFTPAIETTTSTTTADAPTGLDVDLRSPQNLQNPGGIGSAHLRDATVTLPEGLTVNPGSADGLQACSDTQLNIGNEGAVTCPNASKLGTAKVTTPVLAEPLDGEVFLRSQNSDDPESGEMFRLALVIASEERGIRIKLPGSLRVNKDTGRITAVFKDNPQLPVEDIKLAFKSGPRAPLATPATCGARAISTHLVSWAGHDVTLPSPVGVDCAPGLGAFTPAVSAGTAVTTGGAFSPFTLTVSKPDGNAAVSGLSLSLPMGLLARLRGNLNTQVGSVTAYAGPGVNPYPLPGRVYLEGPYGDAPFSLRVVVPAKAGPFDLGDVTVKQKIYVDPITAQVTVVSDPLPTIVKGVPVRLQRLDVNVDKPDFVINPTSCAPKTIGGTLSAVDGQTAPINVRFQVSACASLDLKPSLALALSGKGQTTDGKHPAVTADVTQPAGQANLKKVRVALPLSLALDTDNANGLCEFIDGSKVTPTCPKASIVGTATAVTPILDEPLTGPVYFVKNVRKDPKSGRDIRTLPKLVIPLVGQNGLKLTLTGTSNVENGRLVTTFDNIPDAPVSSFKLNINGGKSGILVVSGDKADICTSTQIAEQQVDGQNNKQADGDVYIQTPSCPLKVLSKKVTKSSVAVKVGGLGAGKVTVTGKGIKKTTKTITKSTVATITTKRTKGTPKQIKVSFLPKGAKKAKVARESR